MAFRDGASCSRTKTVFVTIGVITDELAEATAAVAILQVGWNGVGVRCTQSSVDANFRVTRNDATA